jgi:hypothetical protein
MKIPKLCAIALLAIMLIAGASSAATLSTIKDSTAIAGTAACTTATVKSGLLGASYTLLYEIFNPADSTKFILYPIYTNDTINGPWYRGKAASITSLFAIGTNPLTSNDSVRLYRKYPGVYVADSSLTQSGNYSMQINSENYSYLPFHRWVAAGLSGNGNRTAIRAKVYRP